MKTAPRFLTRRRAAIMAGALVVAAFGMPSAGAGDIIAEWATVKAPPVPELKPVTLEGKTTALLILDLQKPSCTTERRKRCVDTIPKVKALMDAARTAGAMVFYSFAGAGKPEEIADPGLTRQPSFSTDDGCAGQARA